MSKIEKYLGLIGSAVILLNIAVFSVLYPNYNHFAQTISELNAKGAQYALAINIFYTIGFIVLSFVAIKFIKNKNYYAFLSGLLMLLATIIIVYLNWFLPIDTIENVRTIRDRAHNNVITMAVCVFLLSQISAMIFYAKENKKLFIITAVLFVISLVFALMSLWSNLHMSELINIAERGWMISFLVYLSIISYEQR